MVWLFPVASGPGVPTLRLAEGVTTTTCKVTYTYSKSANLARNAKAEAIAYIDGRTRVVASGQIRNRKLKLTFRHLKHGRYRLTLLEVGAHHRLTVIGYTSLVIS